MRKPNMTLLLFRGLIKFDWYSHEQNTDVPRPDHDPSHGRSISPRLRQDRNFYLFKAILKNVMPFNLCNAIITFQHFMERVIRLLINVGVLVYIDDVLIYADMLVQLIEILFAVQKILATEIFKCKTIKCVLLPIACTTSTVLN